ncbi:sigma-54-dependent Fis family transcriptional regulator, partial [bacterium]|nr:sigma-54-dependent Fis family transcriptional regulator [bacterium]
KEQFSGSVNTGWFFKQLLMITAFGSLDTAIQAVQRGAFEYLTKPFDLDEAVSVIRRALESRGLPRPAESAESSVEPTEELLLGSSPVMQDVFRKIAYVAKHDVPVLVTGESGTGKELIAAAIHRYSDRCSGPYIPVCIPAMNESMVESELFGHTKGSFTGAVAERDGLLKAADKGTAFFDEIGDTAVTTQVKLLRVLETKSVTPVGGNIGRTSDFRLVAATNRDLEKLVKTGAFREDLFYRLNVYRIEIPPLRKRIEDIPLLANHFLQRLDPECTVKLSEEALRELTSRHWKGNVRELRNAVEHAVIVTRSGEIHPEAFPPPSRILLNENSNSPTLQQAVQEWWDTNDKNSDDFSQPSDVYEAILAEVEPVLLKNAMKSSNGNRQEAAKRLGMHRQTLRDKLRKYGMNEER